MIICSKAPLRIGLAGGGSDISPYCNIYGGAVVNVTINMYAHCTLKRIEDEIIFRSKDLNVESHHSIRSDISPEGELKLHRGVYNHFIEKYNNGKQIPLYIETYSEAPIGSGIGSSSTLVVAMIKAFGELFEVEMKPYEIASKAYKIEREELALPGGRQDQYSASFGGFNLMEFKGDESKVIRLDISDSMKNEFMRSIFLFYTGKSRDSSLIIGDQISNSKKSIPGCLRGMHGLKDCAYTMRDSLHTGDMKGFIKNLVLGWEYKKMTSSYITNPEIEKLVEYILKNGGLVAKISGAGGGGFLTVICEPEKRTHLIEKLKAKGGESFIPAFENKGVYSWKVEGN